MSGNGYLAGHDGSITFKLPQYRCSVHGVTSNVIHSNIPGHVGEWCQLCWVEMLDKVGVQRVTRIEDEQS